MDKKANILDYPYPGLDPHIFTSEGAMLPDVKSFLLSEVQKVLTGFKNPDKWITGISFVGSLTTYQYLSNSDADLHIKVDLPSFVQFEHPELTDTQAHEVLDQLRKAYEKPNIPGTQHPLEMFFETPYVQKASHSGSGEYDIMADTWVSPPHVVSADFDIEEVAPFLLQTAEETASEVDVSLGKLWRDVKRVEELHDVISAWTTEQKSAFQEKLQKKLSEIESEIQDLIALKEDIVKRRKDYAPLSEQEIKFKYLQRFGYLALISQLEDLVEDDSAVTEDEIPELKQILKTEASQDEGGRLFIDFDRTIVDDKDQLLPGAKEAFDKLKEEGWEIVIYSCRANDDKGLSDIETLLEKYELPYDEIFVGKPKGEFYIDDRAVSFQSWDAVLKQIIDDKVEKKAYLENAYWVDPKGKIYTVRGQTRNLNRTHYDWIEENADMLLEQYGFDWGGDSQEALNELIHDGWVRIGDSVNSRGFNTHSVSVSDLRNIPSRVDDAIARFWHEGDTLEVTDLSNNYVMIEDPFPSLQVAVRKALRDGRLQNQEVDEYGEDPENIIPKEYKPENVPSDKPEFGKPFQKKPKSPKPVDPNQMQLQMSRKPLSKKELHGALADKYWIDPKGQLYKVEGRVGWDAVMGHLGWIEANKELLTTTYGFEFPDEYWEKSQGTSEIADFMIENGWVRVTTETSSNSQFSLELSDVSQIPSHLDNFIAQFYDSSDKRGIEVDDMDGNYVEIADPFPSLQKAVRQALRTPVKTSDFSPSIATPAPINPATGETVIPLDPNSVSDETTYEAPHADKPRKMWEWLLSLFTNKKPKKKADWETPESPVNKPGMDWQWADSVESYVSEILPDMVSSYLELDPKQFTPAILITSIYADDGGVSADVHVDLLEPITNTKAAYMKFKINATIHGDVNYEPEGQEFYDWLEDFEMELLEYGKSGEPPTKLQSRAAKTPMSLKKSWKAELEAIRDEIAGGSPGFRYPVFDPGGYIERYEGSPSTYPEYFQGQGLTAKEVLAWIERALSGGALTERQANVLYGLIESRRRGRLRDLMYDRFEKKNQPKEDPADQYAEEGDTSFDYVAKKAYDWRAEAAWVDPNGKVFRVRSAQKKDYTHVEWVYENQSFLAVEYGIKFNPKDFGSPEEHIFDYVNINEMLISQGWVRVDGNSVQLKSIRQKYPAEAIYELIKDKKDIVVEDLMGTALHTTPDSLLAGPKELMKDFKSQYTYAKKKTHAPTTWDDPRQDLEPFKPLPTTFEWSTNDENLNWRYPWRFMKRPSGPDHSNMGEFQVLMHNKKPFSKKDAAGTWAEQVLQMVKATGGATWNLSKGNMVGTQAYAVSIYPDRSVIMTRPPTAEEVEAYAQTNSDVLSGDGSLGVWHDRSSGKFYLDVVATVADREEAIELGKQHNQIAIFDLKNLEEIPTGGTGEAKASKDTVEMPKDEFIDEHKKLLKVLKSPSHADDLKEYEKQKNELKEYTTEKKAELDGKYWIAPDGAEFEVGDDIHNRWIIDNVDIVKQYAQYGISAEDIQTLETVIEEAEDYELADQIADEIMTQMHNSGWVRVTTDDYTGGYGISIANIREIPSTVDDFLARHEPDGSVFIEDRNESVEVTEDFFPSIQRAVNKALQRKRLQPAASLTKIAEDEGYWIDPNGKVFTVRDDTTDYQTHIEWVVQNKQMLEEQYGISPNTEMSIREVNNQLIEQGWARLGDSSTGDIGIRVKNLRRIPPKVEEVLLSFYHGGTIALEDLAGRLVELPELNTDLQKAVNEALRMPTYAKRAENLGLGVWAGWWMDPDGDLYELEEGQEHIEWLDQKDRTKNMKDYLQEGWVRMRQVEGTLLVHVNETAYLNSPYVNDFILQHPVDKIAVDVEQGLYVELPYEDFVQYGLAKAYNRNRRRVAKKAGLDHAYWIDPNGKVFEVRGPEGDKDSEGKYGPSNTHSRWILDNLEMLHKDYGIDEKTFSATPSALVDLGWVRVGDAFGTDWGVTVKSLSDIPSSVDDLLAKFAPEGSIITVATPGTYADNYTFEWPVKSVQQEVNRIKKLRERVQRPELQVAKQAGSVLDVGGVRVYKNPSSKDLSTISKNFHKEFMHLPTIRALVDEKTGDIYAWDGWFQEHTAMGKALGLETPHHWDGTSDEVDHLYAIREDVVRSMSRKASLEEVNGIKVLVNPSPTELEAFWKRSSNKALRALIDPLTGDIYAWDAWQSEHDRMIRYYGLDISWEEDDGTYIRHVTTPADIGYIFEEANPIKQQHKKFRVASTYTDKEMQEIYDKKFEYNDSPGGGNVYRDWNQSTTDFPKPEDLKRPKVQLDRLMDPNHSNYPLNMPSYEVTWFISQPMGDL